ncbi:MAG: hypothetical protein R3Y63_07510 [Eubacteriales bacterium]
MGEKNEINYVNFEELDVKTIAVKTSYKKPVAINPPDDIEEHGWAMFLNSIKFIRKKQGKNMQDLLI